MTAENRNLIVGAGVALVLGVLVLLQGGYYEGPCGIAGTVCAVLAVACLLREGLRVPGRAAVAPALFALVALAGLASAYANGVSYAQLAALAPWLLFAAAAALFALLRPAERTCAITAVAWLGAGCGVLGVLMFSDVLPFWGSVDDVDGRLYFCFQYANTAGIWFLATSVLALGAPRAALRWAAFPSMAALTLTLSGGAGLVAVVAYLVLAVVWSVRGQWQRVLALFVQGLLALLVCAVGFGARARLALLVLLVGIGVCVLLWWQEREGRLVGRAGTAAKVRGRAAIALACCVVAGVIAVLVLCATLFSSRLQEATGTFMERVVQMHDALVLWGQNLLLGIGPDRWQFELYYVQSATYSVARVHNGYLQLALDAGLVGFLALLAGLAVLLVLAVRRAHAARGDEALWEGRFAVLVAAGTLLLHAVIDFDFSFGAVLVLLALLLSSPFGGAGEDVGVEDAGAPVGRGQAVAPTRTGAIALLVACVLVLLLVELSLWATLTRTSIVRSAQEGDVAAAAEVTRASAFALLDQELVAEVAQAYADAGAWQEAVDLVAASGGVRGAQQACTVAVCQYALGDAQAAEEVLIAELEAEPRNRKLFKQVKALFEEQGLSDANATAYHAAVAAANELLWEGFNPLVDNTEDMPEANTTAE